MKWMGFLLALFHSVLKIKQWWWRHEICKSYQSTQPFPEIMPRIFQFLLWNSFSFLGLISLGTAQRKKKDEEKKARKKSKNGSYEPSNDIKFKSIRLTFFFFFLKWTINLIKDDKNKTKFHLFTLVFYAVCDELLGLYSIDVAGNDQFSASTALSVAYEADQARLFNTHTGPANGGAWVPRSDFSVVLFCLVGMLLISINLF